MKASPVRPERVDAAFDGADDILRAADTHQIARCRSRQEIRREIEYPEHLLLAFADGEPPDGIAIEADLAQ